MLYAIELTNGDYMWDDAGYIDDVKGFTEYAIDMSRYAICRPQFVIDDSLAVKKPSPHKVYVVLFLDNRGGQHAKVGTIRQIKEENDIDLIEAVFSLETLATKGLLTLE